MTGVMSGYGRCWGCNYPFWFDPEKVPTVTIDLATGVPPDVDPETRKPLPEPRQVVDVANLPVCPSCVRQFNAARRAAGMPIAWDDPTDI